VADWPLIKSLRLSNIGQRPHWRSSKLACRGAPERAMCTRGTTREVTIRIDSELRRVGYALLCSYLPASPTEEIVRSIGTPLSLGNRPAIHQLKPIPLKDSTPNRYSGIFGYNQFPLHTDLAHWRFPPRFLMLRCVKGFEAVATLLVDGVQIIEGIDRNIFSRALVRPRRPIDGSLPLFRLYDRQQGDRGLLRWDEILICPASRAGKAGVTKLMERLQRSEPVTLSLAQQGDTLIIDNWRMLHGRSPIPSACRGRVLDRAYLEKLH
jgi:L-asparagine oxygenase